MKDQTLHDAIQHHKVGRLSEAQALYEQVLRKEPDHPEALRLSGIIAWQRGKYVEAEKLINRAIQVNGSRPYFYNDLGNVYCDMGRYDDAIACYRQTLARQPDYAVAHYNLGLAYYNQSRLDEAVAAYQQALKLKPDYAVAHYNLGIAYLNQSKLDEAVAAYQQALFFKPNYAEAYINLGVAFMRQGRLKEAMPCFDKGLALNPALAAEHSTKLFSLLYLAACPPETLFAEHRRFAELYETPLKPLWRAHANPRDPERRLKVGYVSADLRRHSVAYFMMPVFTHHDPAQVEIYCYFNHRHRDEVTELIKARADHWVPCVEWTDEQLSERIRADGIDILVDLAGHTQGNRLLAFARKPAPVQVTYLGYAGTTGLSAMDYRLCTWDTDPLGSEAWHSESLYRLPRSLWCYRPRIDRLENAESPPRMKNSFVTFGSFNTFAKISPETIAVWVEILRTLPAARLVMTCVPKGTARHLLRERFAAQGIAPERVVLYSKLPTPRYREVLRQIDIAFDSFPYNGTTTTCDTLWHGIPVVSLIGQTSASRSGYALLKAVGLEALAANDETDYVRTAVELANDPDRLRELRAGLHARFEASALRDEAGFTRELEAAYRTMWRSWCLSD